MKRPFYIAAGMIFLIACARDGKITDNNRSDASSLDTGAIMQDAQFLEQVPYDATLGMPGPEMDGMEGADAGTYPEARDTVSADSVGNARDVDSLDALSEIDDCGGCPKGYACQAGECVYAAQCDNTGLVDLDALGPIMNGAFVKLKGEIQVGKPSCSLQECSKDNPCCQSCFAPLKLGPLTLKGDGFSIGCLGTNCDYQQKCTPFDMQNAIYIIWGRLMVSGFDLELQVQGFCKDE